MVRAAMDAVRSILPRRVLLADVASQIGISSSRLTHRFSGEVGLPFGRWVLWERLGIAARSVSAGSSLTTAAHAAGFADSSHLTRTFRQMFGIAPSTLSPGTERPEPIHPSA
jgi:AraC-like DNA-binding protein